MEMQTNMFKCSTTKLRCLREHFNLASSSYKLMVMLHIAVNLETMLTMHNIKY